MKKREHRGAYGTAAKVAAAFMTVILAMTCVLCAGCAVYMSDRGFYTASGAEILIADALSSRARAEAYNALYGYVNYAVSSGEMDAPNDAYAYSSVYSADTFTRVYASENSNFSFTITDGDGDTLYQNYASDDYLVSGQLEETLGDTQYLVQYAVRAQLSARDSFHTIARLYAAGYALRYAVTAASAAAFVATLILFIYLMCAAGRRPDYDGVYIGALTRIPLDLHLMLIVASAILCAYVVLNLFGGLYTAIAAAVMAFIFGLLAVNYCVCFAARAKAGKFWRHTLIYIVLHGFFHGVIRLLRSLPRLWRALFLLAALFFTNMIALAAALRGGGFGVLLLLIWWLAASVLLLIAADNYKTLEKAGGAIATGDTQRRVDLKTILPTFRGLGEDLNGIGDGVQKAVDARMKSERFKTELITNVSHDLKTPITSIVNYIDLMKKENISPEIAREYLEVLDRQTARLRKLTADLVEASKAATGNTPVELAETDVGVLLEQCVGEYADRFAQSGLEAIVDDKHGDARIMADSALLWRVFDNLLGNVCKYAQSGTRVYISAARQDGSVVVAFRNVSRDRLNISSDELMERFVRGDASRSTDGSGLGLSIAKSLTELQGGRFNITIDGDLFKAAVTFAVSG